MSLMARLCAVWLVALITAPWCAPFPVCDLSTIFDHVTRSTSSARGPLHPAAAVDDATAHAVPVVRTSPRVPVMDAVDHPSPWLTLSVSSQTVPLRPAVILAKSPLVLPLRI